MPDKFLFALKLTGEPRLNAMLDDLARCVLEQTGLAPSAIADTMGKLRVALREGADRAFIAAHMGTAVQTKRSSWCRG